ncbi:ABC transporter ATP-binding protein [Cyanobium sp. Aljojuca 7A6]|nr:ABC transporter ATP-binding protein [Cyanobium sp. La Preciosa 7G6]MCP9937214.1 ABC transporter ATP-binding protein [Cyanobium sp. Aljojuca 7A6]
MNSTSEIAVTVRSLGKSYRIDHLGSVEPSDAAKGGSRGRWPWQSKGPRQRMSSEIFWALRDVDFEVPRGKVFGVIGRNGAGKSTLLKILSRITEPTTGMAEIRGRVGSLLEVGTGFHPELSGRENIYLNGTLLGMRRRQIDQVFDAIVDFAEVHRFIDTPVKRYSSGMYVRLAFAVAAHLEPDILIIDEVLAVGDLQFQKKCLGKMKDVTGQGRTVLFVSHSLSTVNTLCDTCMLLENGRVTQIGPTESVTASYFASSEETAGSLLDLTADPLGDQVCRMLGARMVDRSGERLSYAHIEREFGIEMTYELMQPSTGPVIPNFHFFTAGQCAFITSPLHQPPASPGRHHATVWLPSRFLNEGTYSVNFAATTPIPQCCHFHVQDQFCFDVIEDLNDEARHGAVHKVPGAVRPQLNWSLR